MRDIIFRGKRTDNGDWVEGIPINTHIGTFIVFEENPHYCSQYGYMEIDELTKVIPVTVGQYTGLTDKNGKKIFEGDIVKLLSGDEEYVGKIILLQNDHWQYVAQDKDGYCTALNFYWKYIEVIGNIYDNPELLKDGEQM